VLNLVRVRLAQQGEGADRLDDVELQSVTRRSVVNWLAERARQTGRCLFQVLDGLDAEVEAARKRLGQAGIAAHGDQTICECFEVAPAVRTAQSSGNGFIFRLSFGLPPFRLQREQAAEIVI